MVITLAPRLGNVLGGTPVLVSGPCLEETDNIVCTFDGVVVDGVYINETMALCVSPCLSTIGRVVFEVNVTTLNGTIKFEGETAFFSCK